MSPQDALNILTNATAQLQLNRADHQTVQLALQSLEVFVHANQAPTPPLGEENAEQPSNGGDTTSAPTEPTGEDAAKQE